ncbi:hypothetical protein MRX96_016516 [Rhipicephalus microplus]
MNTFPVFSFRDDSSDDNWNPTFVIAGGALLFGVLLSIILISLQIFFADDELDDDDDGGTGTYAPSGRASASGGDVNSPNNSAHANTSNAEDCRTPTNNSKTYDRSAYSFDNTQICTLYYTEAKHANYHYDETHHDYKTKHD